MDMKSRSHIVIALLLFSSLLLLPTTRAAGQESQDNQHHIQPRTTPTPTSTPTPAASQNKDKYERPPFPGDASPAQPNDPSKAPDKYERPPFPGDAPGTNPTGGSATGESSSRDTLINLDNHPAKEEPAPAEEDESVLKPWDPHKAAKDVEVGQWYLKLKNYRAALERFNSALSYKPDDAEAIYGLAFTQEKLDLLSLADSNYRKYLGILPNGPRSKEAEEALKRIAPNVAMRKPGDTNADAAKLATHDIDVGETYLSGNHFDAARERFEEAMRFSPDNPLIWFRLAQALQGMQRLDPARLYYKKYLEAQPKGKFAGNAKKAISQIDWILGK
jgi:Tfp pilus assembly protein PilF